MALVRISDADLKRAERGSLKIQNAKNRQKIAICAPSHNFRVLAALMHGTLVVGVSQTLRR